MVWESVVEIGQWLWERRDQLRRDPKARSRLPKSFKTRNLLVTGISGVGKTTLLNKLNHDSQLVGLHNQTIRVQERNLTLKPVDGDDDVPFRVLDLPGDSGKAEARAAAYATAIKEGGYGVLNVVCFGYAEPPSFSDDLPLDQARFTAYRHAKMAAEQENFNEWTSRLIYPGGPVDFVVTLVEKADLWWDRAYEDEAALLAHLHQHYRTEDGVKRLQGIDHLVLPLSNVGRRIGMLRPNGDYDEVLRQRHLDRFIIETLKLAGAR